MFSVWFAIAARVASFVLPLIPQLQSHDKVIDAVVKGIPEAEQLKSSASGAEKKSHVLTLVQLAANATNAERPGTLDSGATQAAASAAIDTIVAVTNIVHAAHKDQIAASVAGV